MSHAPLDPRSSTMIAWLADAGGWGHNKDASRFRPPSIAADATTPYVPFRKGPGFYLGFRPGLHLSAAVPKAAWKGSRVISAISTRVTATSSWSTVATANSTRPTRPTMRTMLSAQTFSLSGTSTVSIRPQDVEISAPVADAAGFPIAPLLFNADELATGSINHAIRFILPNPRIRAKVFVHPATHAGAPAGRFPLRRWAPASV